MDRTEEMVPGEIAPAQARELLEEALFQVKQVIAGQEALLERLLIGLLAEGHLLIEGVPGLAKTRTVRTLAETLGGSWGRVQFTPDLVPSDLVGTRVWRPDQAEFAVELGPVFCNFLLADEINRAPAKVQSALLEVMAERQVTLGAKTYALPSPFLVMATQNPIESEGTYPLPEAQMDRFLLKIVVDYPSEADELEVVRRSIVGDRPVTQILDADSLQACQRARRSVYVDQHVAAYAVALTQGTRRLADLGHGDLAAHVSFGASPRGSLGLVAASQALALLRGRRYVVPDDVADIAHDVLRHRIVCSYHAAVEGISADDVVDAVLATIPAPIVQLGA